MHRGSYLAARVARMKIWLFILSGFECFVVCRKTVVDQGPECRGLRTPGRGSAAAQVVLKNWWVSFFSFNGSFTFHLGREIKYHIVFSKCIWFEISSPSAMLSSIR